MAISRINFLKFKKMNEQTKADGMKLLEAVIQSNEKNIYTTNSLINQLEETERSTDYFSLQVKSLERERKNFENFIEKEWSERKLFLEKLPKSIEARMSSESQKTIDDFKNQLSVIKKILYTVFGFLVLSIIVIFTLYKLSINWYTTSINTKKELIESYEAEGKAVFRKEYVDELESNTKIFNLWLQRNPKQIKSFKRFEKNYNNQ